MDPADFLSVAGILAASGAFAGFLAGLLGIGGGVIFVPVLYFVLVSVFGVLPENAIVVATATSLGCMIPTSTVSCLSHYRARNMDTGLIRRWSPWLILGVLLGSLFSSRFGGLWLSALFGCVLLLSSANTLLRAKAPPLRNELPSRPWQALMAMFISGFSVMLGIGGGTLSVPLLTLFGMDPRKAIGTAAAIGLFIAVPGAVGMLLAGGAVADPSLPPFTYGRVCLLAVLCIVPFSMLLAVLGARVNRMLDPVLLKRIFCVLLILTGLKMQANALM